MAKTFEQEAAETAMKAVLGGFAKHVKSVSVPSKSYMAVSRTFPVVGKHYNCYRIERSAGQFRINYTETSTVQEVSNLANNVFVVTTRNSYYITRILDLPVEDVHFAALYEAPEVGQPLRCQKIDFTHTDMKTILWQTTTVLKSSFIKGLYKVKTENSIYVCLPPR